MGFREVSVIEVREVLRGLGEGAGLRTVAERAAVGGPKDGPPVCAGRPGGWLGPFGGVRGGGRRAGRDGGVGGAGRPAGTGRAPVGRPWRSTRIGSRRGWPVTARMPSACRW